MTDTVFSIDLALLALLGGTFMPLLVGLLAKLHSAKAKAVLNIVLAAAAGLIAQAIEGGGILTSATLLASATALVAAVATYFGVWKPIGATPAIEARTAHFGLDLG